METENSTEQLNGALAGRYLIEREIGKGGMATVYLARDLRHDRKVALKLLLAELGAILGPERFLSEIRVTANLQHPNLLPLFDSGEAGGRLFYVMPYVEGESLRHRLDREKQIGVDEAIRIAVSCANALDYAHRHGVIHRDLKPENILLSAGQPVIADFGIARAVTNAGGARITQSGLSLGTPQYMSPEQAAGDREVDAKSDIYSLACVLYEMLTGDPPHTGSTVQAVIAKVLVEKPRGVRAQRDRVPEHVDAAIERALAKIPADRWATAGEFCQALSDPGVTAALRESSLHRSSLAYSVRPNGRVARLLWPAVAAAALVVAAIGWWRASARPSPKPLTLAISTPPSAQLAVDPSVVVFAPDGQSIVYAASVRGRRKLFVRELGNLAVAEIRGTDEARGPFFSPDGKWIAFGLETNGVYRIPAGGGNAVKIADAREYRGGTWSQTGDIVYSADGKLLRVPATGGTPEILTQPDSTKGERAHIQPMFLPDGETMVFRVEDVTSRANDRLAVVAIGEKSYRLLGVTGGNPLALIDGMLYFGRPGGFISVVPFDAGQRKVTGESAIAVEEVSVYAGAAASFAPDGSLVYVRSSNASALVMTDERGVELTSAGEEHRYFRPRLSPDGRTIAVGISSGGANRSDIWAYDVASKALTRITSQGTSEQPEWTPDGRYIVYLREFNGKFEIWRVPADGSGAEEKLFGGEQSVREAEISPDGKQLVLGVVSPRTGRDLLLLSLGSNNAKPFLVSGFNELSSRISPDNRWVTYISDESGRYEVYVRRLSGTGPRVQVSIGGGTEPLWTANGSRIVYRAGEKFVAAILTGGGEVSVSERRELFNDTYRSASMRSSYDVDRSGSRFVLLRQVGTSEIVVVLNGTKQMLAATSRKR